MNIRVAAGGQSFLFLFPADVVTIFGTVPYSWESMTQLSVLLLLCVIPFTILTN